MPAMRGFLIASTICGTRHPVVTNKPAIATAVGETVAATANAEAMNAPSITSWRHALKIATTDNTPSASTVFTNTIPHWADDTAHTTQTLPDAAYDAQVTAETPSLPSDKILAHCGSHHNIATAAATKKAAVLNIDT